MKVNNITSLKNIPIDNLSEVCEDIRKQLVSCVTENGGHLASSLGAVELAVALRYVFDENDKVCWDVGHQAYADKILTDRGENFFSLRKKGGISGFPDATESSYDSFTVGHAGTAISQALGLCRARDVLGEKYNVIAVVGDGSLTCGLSYEALNNVKDTNLLIIVNDNNMSISESVGTSTLNLSKLRVGSYDRRKQRLKRTLNAIPLVGKPVYRFLRWCKRRAKLGFYRNSYFDNFDIKYIGIIDGNEIKDLVYYLKKIKQNVTKPTVLHVVTKKGKGYAPAEENPEIFHAVMPSDKSAEPLDCSVVVGDTLCELGKNGRTAVVCAAMSQSVGFDGFKKQFPNRFFDVGIAEEHAITFAGGLCKGGIKPYVGIYSTFMQRAYDQIIHDVALQGLPVTLLMDRAGLVGEDGKTHQGLFDLAFLRSVPNMLIWTPATYSQLAAMIKASETLALPNAIRYSKTLLQMELPFDGSWVVVRKQQKPKLCILAVGARMLNNALEADLPDTEVVCVTTVKPLDEAYLTSLSCPVLTLEEGMLDGGFGEAVSCFLSSREAKLTVRSLGVRDKFVAHATVQEQLVECGLDVTSIRNAALALLQ